MGDYKKIEIYPDVKRTSNIKKLIEIYDSKQFTDWYFGYFFEHEDSSYQCIKSDNNNSKEKISSYSDKYLKEGNHEPEWIKESFDETIRVHEGIIFDISLIKLTTKGFIDDFFLKLKEYYLNNENNEELSIMEFFDDSDIEMWSYDCYENIIEELGGDSSDFEVIHDSIDIDEEHNLIKWFSYELITTDEFFIGYD